MKNTQKLKLIDGDFTPQEAKEILLNIFSSKIQFHEMKNFSSKERFGKEDETAVKRIPQLKNSIEKILKVVSDADAKNEMLTISSEINIHFSNSK